ncbi:stomatin-like protein 1 [Ascaphus truei]|uniref:stomatin-like protein 1 n=1 Tax=Ascaphus truei TaxID=8439 RepID=UPI003F5A97B4
MWGHSGYNALPLGLDEPPPSLLLRTPKPAPHETWLTWGCHTAVSCLSLLLLIITFPISAWCAFKVVPDYQRVVIFRLGRVRPPRGPGLILLLPMIDQWQRVDMRVKAFSVPPCKVRSRDGALVSLGADVQFRVCDPVLSMMSVQDLSFVMRSTSQHLLAQTLGRKNLREIQSDRLRIGEQLREDIGEQVKPWGVSVERVELALEAVLRMPEDTLIGPLDPHATPPSAGLEQLVMQFISLANQSSGISDTPPTTGHYVPGSLELQQLLSGLEGSLSESLVSEVGASYQLYVTLCGGEKAAYYLDLTSGSGSSGWGVLPRPPDVTLETSEADLLSLLRGDLHPLSAYTGGRLRVGGDLQTALRLEVVLRASRH